MSTNVEGTVEDVQGRVDHLKASLKSRVEELGRRFKDARNKFDIEATIIAHPLPAVGIALALGAVVALVRTRTREVEAQRGLGGAIVAGLGALTLRLAKDLAMSQVSGAARTWFERGQEAEPSASRGRSEPFLEH